MFFYVVVFYVQFVDTPFEKDEAVQDEFLWQFLDDNGIRTPQLERKMISEDIEYKKQWFNYCKLRISMLNHFNNNKEFGAIYNRFIFKRNEICRLPSSDKEMVLKLQQQKQHIQKQNNNEQSQSQLQKSQSTQSQKSNNSNNNNKNNNNSLPGCYQYYLLWNAMYQIFYHFQCNKTDITKKQVISSLKSYLLLECDRTHIFDKESKTDDLNDLNDLNNSSKVVATDNSLYINWEDDDDDSDWEEDDYEATIIENLFNNNHEALDELLEYCLQDLSEDSLVYYGYRQSGIQYFVINRMVMGLYNHYISGASTGGDGGFKHFKHFQDILPFFEFIWDFSVYNQCLARTASMRDESFYISQFFKLQNYCFNFDKNIVKCKYSAVGTLLHSSTDKNMIYYCRALLNCGFNNVFSMFRYQNQGENKTCYEIARIKGNSSVIQLYDTIRKNLTKKNKTKNKNKNNDSDDSNNNNNNNSNNNIRLSELEATYIKLKQQKEASNLFLMFLGCDMTNCDSIKDVPNVSVQRHAPFNVIQNPYHFTDELYFDYGKFSKITMNKQISTHNASIETMNVFANTVKNLVSYKMPVNDEMLVLAFEYCTKFNKQLADEFEQVLRTVSQECLCTQQNSDNDKDNDNENKEEITDDNNEKTKPRNFRDYLWFNRYIAKSNLLLLQCAHSDSNDDENVNNGKGKGNNEKNENNENSKNSENSTNGKTGSMKNLKANVTDEVKTKTKIAKVSDEIIKPRKGSKERKGSTSSQDGVARPKRALLYDVVDKTVDEALLAQKQYIYDNVLSENTKEAEAWQQVQNFGLDWKNEEDSIELRQDKIENGVYPDFTESDLFGIAPLIDNSNYDAFQQYNIKNYLTKCLVIGHSCNQRFQNDMKTLFAGISDKLYFQPAPVKTEERCIIKAQVTKRHIRLQFFFFLNYFLTFVFGLFWFCIGLFCVCG